MITKADWHKLYFSSQRYVCWQALSVDAIMPGHANANKTDTVDTYLKLNKSDANVTCDWKPNKTNTEGKPSGRPMWLGQILLTKMHI